MAEVFATGIQGESPRWHGHRFWMCDRMAGEVLAFDVDGSREVVARVAGLPFSIDWLPDGRLVATTPGGLVAGRSNYLPRPALRCSLPWTRASRRSRTRPLGLFGIFVGYTAGDIPCLRPLAWSRAHRRHQA
jgi:hypothetical protein